MTKSWTDERLEERFDGIDRRFDEMNVRFDTMNARFDAMQRVMIQFGGLIVAALIGLLATQL